MYRELLSCFYELSIFNILNIIKQIFIDLEIIFVFLVVTSLTYQSQATIDIFTLFLHNARMLVHSNSIYTFSAIIFMYFDSLLP